MKPIRVMVVDDSAFARDMIIGILSEDKDIIIVGEAANGQEALEKIPKLKPDLITIDIHMPVMDGLETIPRIMAVNAIPILVVTSSCDANTAYKAISKGALEVIHKPTLETDTFKAFINNVKLLSKVKVIPHIRGDHVKKTWDNISPAIQELNIFNALDRLIAIASSTGGPKALSILLSAFPKHFPLPIVVAQHIDDEFVSGMAEWLGNISKLKVKIGEAGELITGGVVYLSPSRKHMVIDKMKRIAFKNSTPADIYFPSCNALLSSVAQVYGSKSIGIILTGMGDDGASGMKQIKEKGGITIAQDEKTSVVFGMPKIAIESGCIDKVLPIDEIYAEIANRLKQNL